MHETLLKADAATRAELKSSVSCGFVFSSSFSETRSPRAADLTKAIFEDQTAHATNTTHSILWFGRLTKGLGT